MEDIYEAMDYLLKGSNGTNDTWTDWDCGGGSYKDILGKPIAPFGAIVSSESPLAIGSK